MRGLVSRFRRALTIPLMVALVVQVSTAASASVPEDPAEPLELADTDRKLILRSCSSDGTSDGVTADKPLFRWCLQAGNGYCGALPRQELLESSRSKIGDSRTYGPEPLASAGLAEHPLASCVRHR